jgi:hypothetical protein
MNQMINTKERHEHYQNLRDKIMRLVERRFQDDYHEWYERPLDVLGALLDAMLLHERYDDMIDLDKVAELLIRRCAPSRDYRQSQVRAEA